ncbi:hypothetical protein E4U30_006083 [Claviceps sp. LM220 group G6]|nr:hypothetical protein E4U32_000080 [Claviceps aff. humidiphila group G2b]KAG6075147.1 hypothetical protein E4U15_005786 [Claviceps sp. LM218 group G6]KAG6091995.1 hypothetical protein E4U30_006083 [Claviceps sp. LM220 group G6]KAG6095666.1 hypothetical protein E4U31_005759 [Claviceps sp. LM219 group G6]KAG6119079.1 hypothetical protein E4U14_005883 [Claviceps sp. LM454 group G7]
METPRSPSKHGKALDPDRLQIRIVPYSPPRINNEGSTSSLPASRAANSTSALSSAQDRAYRSGYVVAHNPDPDCHTTLATDLKCGESAKAMQVNLNAVEKRPPLTPASPSTSHCRSNRVIAVNADKTFSVLAEPYPQSSVTDWTQSPRRLSTSPNPPVHQTIADSFAEAQPSSPLATPSTPLEVTQSYSEDRTPLQPNRSQVEASSSPWNYELNGGLRKVPKSASRKRVHDPGEALFLAGSRSGHDSTASGSLSNGPHQAGNLLSKQSLHSYLSISSMFDMNNNMLTPDSPCLKQKKGRKIDKVDTKSMSTSSNQPDAEVPSDICSKQSSDDRSRSSTSEGNSNYVLHQDLPVVPTSDLPSSTDIFTESVGVAPLRSPRRHLVDQINASVRRCTKPIRHRWSPMPFKMVTGSDTSRRLSFTGLHNTTSGGLKREPGPQSLSLAPDLDVSQLETWIDRPQPTYSKAWAEAANSSSLRLIRDQDEHGDGLAELGTLPRYPSRTRLHSYLSSVPSDRNLCSAGSSRSTSSIRSYMPTWARLYYGGGERRFLLTRQSSESLCSNFTRYEHRSPPMGRSAIFQISQPANQRQNLNSIVPRSAITSRAPSDSGDLKASHRQLSTIRKIRKQTSSIWSPHLGRDKRALMYCLWRPPSSVAAREKTLSLDRVQTFLFVLGFAFPFAWMIASFLPLPSPTGSELRENIHSTSHLDLEQGTHIKKEVGEVRASYHDREKWWRMINRYMSIIGVFMIGAVVALTITGTQQQWKS